MAETASNANVVDELVVTLTLDASEYDKTDKLVDAKVNKTTKTQDDAARKDKQRDAEAKRREQDKQKRLKEMTGTVKELSGAALAVLGIGGGMAGIVGMLAGLASTESAMKRATVATGMNVRQMNAWRMTAQRLTGDAEGGAAAVAQLAREQQTGRYTGDMPTIAALASVGVSARQGESVESILSRAQDRYRALPAPQRQNMENILGAQGVDANIIRAITSNQSIAETYQKSFGESANMDEKGVDAFNDALASLKNNLRDTATVLMQTLTPAISSFAQAISAGAQWLSSFSNDMQKAGGGVQGFTDTLATRSPKLASALDLLYQGAEVIAFGFREIALVVGKAYEWINSKLGGLLNLPGAGKGSALDKLGDMIKGLWSDTVHEARGGAPGASVHLTESAQRRVAAGALGATTTNTMPGKLGDPAMQFMNELIASGYTPAQAAAVTASAKRESGFNAAVHNPAGGGEGAQGVLQWRGPRIVAFREMFGYGPDQASTADVVKFLRTDPEEARSLRAAFAQGGTAQQLGANFSARFERHGKVAEDAARGTLAQNYYNDWMKQTNNGANPPAGVSAGITITGPVTVQADNPQEFMTGMQRVSGVNNYNSATR